MSGFFRTLRRFFGAPKSPDRIISDVVAAGGPNLSKFAEGDRVLIDRKRLSGPLAHGQRHETPHGFIAHADVIGKPSLRAWAKTNTGHALEIAYPTLDEFVALAPRKVTPVYASYASLIVSFFDIHVSHPGPESPLDAETAPLEILESGTGHGSLSLHLARAIAVANPPPPYSLPPLPSSTWSGQQSDHPLLATWAEWRKKRRAVIHTVEVSPTWQTHANRLIRSFRQGIYWPHIDFHAMDVGDWVASQVSTRPQGDVEKGFLQYAVLDMPGVHKKIPAIVSAMKDDALLAIFVPSVTQIGDCVKEIEKHNLPLAMEKVVELGEGISNGRIWDVRLVKMRNNSSTASKDANVVSEAGEETNSLVEEDVTPAEQGSDGETVFVCRPKVGRLTIGGGFVGVWRKIDPSSVRPEERRSGKPSRSARTTVRRN